MKLAAAFTQGDSDYLFVGGTVSSMTAAAGLGPTIVRISDTPISIRQSFLSPYKKASAFVGEQFAKFAASKDKAVQGALARRPARQPRRPRFSTSRNSRASSRP